MLRIFNFLSFILAILGFSTISYSQTFIGAQVDNRGGVQSVLMNPANAAGSQMRLDINLLSGSAFVGSDYLYVDLSEIKNFQDGFDFNTDVKTIPKDQNNFFGNVDILGPSVLFNLNDKNSIAITSRFRTFFNLHNLGGELYEVASSNEVDKNFNLNMEGLSGIIHAWGEIGGTFGRVLIAQDQHLLKAGVTLKYLFGAGGIYGSSGRLVAQYDAGIETLATSGNLNYGYTSGFDSDDISFSDIKSGFGTDLGAVYEFYSNNSRSVRTPYKLKIGVSVTDIGSIKYSGSTNARYQMDATIDANEFDNKDLEELLKDNFPGLEELGDAKLSLPTALQLFVDYQITSKFYVSTQGAISIKKGNIIPVSNIINAFTVTPRFEMKWISVYSPISVRQYDSSLAWGVGLRVGPVIVGSGSILTNLISSNSNSTDVYVGFKVPLYK
ncbi:DUF5723 family protein [Algoriphagus sp.]|uniref:DUF5723 family protein n=1 Tax=Algoriphagus sp. TaxID=1872435 RepID=UPI0025CD78BE|nr:DUF5723 family protein [Algoriphagus sp.]